MRQSLIAAALLAALCAPLAHGQSCAGDPGFGLTATPAVVGFGDPVEICIDSPAGTMPILFVSLGQGPTPTPIGPLCLDFPVVAVSTFPPLPTGKFCLPTYRHCLPAFDGVAFHLQYAGIGPNGLSDSGLSNSVSVTAVDQGNGCNFCAGPGAGTDKPSLLRMKYTGDDCSATDHSQSAGQVTCTGDPADAPLVRIVAQDDKPLGHQNAYVWFDGEVKLGHLFDVEAAAAGMSQLKGVTRIYILDLQGAVLQMVSFHTSCSEPLHAEDQFGAIRLEAFVGQ